MSISELKEEAIRQFAIKVESLDDEAALKVVLEFLNGIRSNNVNALSLSRHYADIKAEGNHKFNDIVYWLKNNTKR